MISKIFRAPEGLADGGSAGAATLTTAPAVGAHASAPLGPISAARAAALLRAAQGLFDPDFDLGPEG